MVAQVVKVERSSPRERVAQHPLLADIAAGIAHLRERGALSFGRAYVATTRTEEHQILLAARASGASTAELAYLLDAKSAVPHLPSTLQELFLLLRTSVLKRPESQRDFSR
jgi:aminoglycoside phosphotransferase